MTLDQLQYFHAAAKYEHIGKAAQAIRISPSAVSGAVASLEDELGCSLFERRLQRIRLTQHGKRLKEHCERLFAQVQSIRDDLQEGAPRFHGNYRLGASPFLAKTLLAPAWFKLQKDFPDLTCEISSMHTGRVVSEIAQGLMDFGLCFSPQSHPELEQSVLHRGTLKIAVRKGHSILRLPRSEQFLALSRLPATLHKSSPGVDVCETHPIFSRFEIQPQVQVLFDSDDQAISKLLSSDSWALLPGLVIESTQGKLQSLATPKGWDAPYTVSLVHRRLHGDSPIVAAVKEVLLKSLVRRVK